MPAQRPWVPHTGHTKYSCTGGHRGRREGRWVTSPVDSTESPWPAHEPSSAAVVPAQSWERPGQVVLLAFRRLCKAPNFFITYSFGYTIGWGRAVSGGSEKLLHFYTEFPARLDFYTFTFLVFIILSHAPCARTHNDGAMETRTLLFENGKSD